MRVGGAVLLSFLLLVGALPQRAGAEDPAPASFDEVQKKHRKAFKSLGLPKAGKLEKAVLPLLPEAIVIESGPFDRLVESLLSDHAPRLDLREEVLAELAAHPSPKAGKAVKTALGVLGKEGADLLDRIADVEEAYGKVYNQGYMESGEGVRRTRKLAAVLIPLYRRLQARALTATERAVDALAAMREGEALAWLVAAARGDAEVDLRAAAVRALGRVGGDEPLAVLRNAAREDAAARVRLRALLALAAWPLKQVNDAIVASLRDKAWEVRATAVAMCAAGNLVEAAGPLIDALAEEQGRLRQDIDDALFRLVGARMYADVALWKRWWGENRDAVLKKATELEASGAYDAPLGPVEDWPRGEADDAEDEKERSGTTTFYGIRTLSKRIVYIVDISRSMNDEAGETPPVVGDARHPYAKPKGRSKLAIARWQLHRAVHDLPEDAHFAIVVYSESYKLWETEMVRAKGRAKKKAHDFISGLRGNGTTNICDSLDKALAMAGVLGPIRRKKEPEEQQADTIFLLSDGDPNRGRISDLRQLLEAWERTNRTARMVVHTIGIGEAAGSSFLKDLASRSGGRYVGFR